MKKAMAFALTAVLALGVLGLAGCESQPQGSGTQSQDGKPVLTVAMELAYPPFETKDDAGQPAGLAVDFMRDFADRYGYDLVYSPAHTAFMSDCEKAGAKTAGGLGMLIYQAIAADGIFLGCEPPAELYEEIRKTLEKELS